MKKQAFWLSVLIVLLLTGPVAVYAQNPIILDQFTADPAARVFEGKVYLYPSHDIRSRDERGRNWFCMADYHVFSSENLTEWTDHGIIVSQNNVPWVDSTRYSMWAPDCIYRDGKYYFYFPAAAKAKSGSRGMAIGIATSDKPYGPFIPEPEPMKGVSGIDPNPLIDKNGQAYLCWAGMRQLTIAKLKANMKELASEPYVIPGLPAGFKEGPYLFERKGIYYLTFPYVIDSTETLAYAMGDSPMGPFKYVGVIMDQSPTHCWTNQHSIIEYRGEWYLFYHHNDLSPDFDKNRSTRIDYLHFNQDGTIQKVIPTLRGVGISDARKKIQIDRYSAVSDDGASVSFMDTLNRPEGWKTTFSKKGAWIRYNRVDFGDMKPKSVDVRAVSGMGGAAEIRLDSTDGPRITRVAFEKKPIWDLFTSDLSEVPTGVHDVIVLSDEDSEIEIDWIRFK